MTRIKDKIPHPTSVGRHLNRHRGKYAAAATAAACFALSRKSVNDWNEFLKENDLYETYYAGE